MKKTKLFIKLQNNVVCAIIYILDGVSFKIKNKTFYIKKDGRLKLYSMWVQGFDIGQSGDKLIYQHQHNNSSKTANKGPIN
jgi:hypothetical protein